MKCKMHVLATPDETVTPAHVICFAHQLKRDLASEMPKLRWDHDMTTPKFGVYVSSGLSPGSKIIIEPFAIEMQSGIRLSYLRNGEPIFSAYELSGKTKGEQALCSLYAAITAAVVKAPAKGCVRKTQKYKLE